MNKKLLALAALFIIFNNAQAGITTYSCMEDKYVANGKVINPSKSAKKLTVDSEWYGKPTTVTTHRVSGEKEFILSSTQDKIEWLKSDTAEFSLHKTGENGASLTISLSLTKSKPIKVEFRANRKYENTVDNIVSNLSCIAVDQ